MSRISKTLVLASGVMTWAAVEAEAAEYRCQKKDSSLRIAIEVKKDGHTLPCEVIAEDDRGDRAVLYSAQYDRDYCPSRIERTKGELEQEGWTCEMTSEENVVNARDVTTVAGDRQTSEPSENENGSGGALVARNGKVITESQQCRLGEDVRRIRIEVEDPARGKPCELIYWADGDQTRPGQLLWRAEHDAAFCPTRLSTITGKWADEGWQCDGDSLQTAAVDAAPVPPVESQAETGIQPNEATSGQQAQPVQQAQAEGQSEIEAADDDAVDSAVDPKLEAIIAADAERIGEWMEVEPAIEIAARGDLNDDGSDDAVVFLAYQSDQAAYRQYLMSYLVADDGYELASVKLLTGVGAPPDHARVEQIDKGVIWLTFPENSGSAPLPTGFKLRDQQLIEVDVENGSPAPAD